MNKYDFISLENIVEEMGTAYLDRRFDDVASLAGELISIANEVKYASLSAQLVLDEV